VPPRQQKPQQRAPTIEVPTNQNGDVGVERLNELADPLVLTIGAVTEVRAVNGEYVERPTVLFQSRHDECSLHSFAGKSSERDDVHVFYF
jgi:hypothetical protein